MRRLALPLLLIGAPVQAAQQDSQLWLQTNVHIPLAKTWRVTLEGIARTSDRLDGLYQTEIGALLTHKLSPHVELGFGYRHVGSHGGSTAADEERIRQQVVGTYAGLTGRLRIDERFNPRGSEVGFRIRPLLRYNHRLNAKGFGLFASHESFFLPNSTDWGQRAGYERMRNLVGVIVPLGKGLSADIGYLNQYRFGRGGARATMDHALSLQLTLTLAPGRPHPPRADD